MKHFPKRTLLILLPVLGIALAASSAYKITLNGQASRLTTATVGGKTYIPLEVLEKLGVPYTITGNTLSVGTVNTGSTTAGGANERPSLEGCMNEYLFNGVWRIKATKLDKIFKDGDPHYPGWGVTLEFRNGSKTTLMPTNAGVDGTGIGIQVAFGDANTLSVDALDVQKMTFANLPQGGVTTQQLKFFYPYPLPNNTDTYQAPKKLLLEVNPKGIGDSTKAKGVAFNTPNPSFRVNLTCSK
jgi:hypothetical protein